MRKPTYTSENTNFEKKSDRGIQKKKILFIRREIVHLQVQLRVPIPRTLTPISRYILLTVLSDVHLTTRSHLCEIDRFHE